MRGFSFLHLICLFSLAARESCCDYEVLIVGSLMLSTPNIPLRPALSVRFSSKIRFEKPEVFQQGLKDNQIFSQMKQTDPLILGDSTYQSPDWQLFEQSRTINRNSAQPVPCYPWGKNSISRLADIYTGAMITGTGGGVTDGTAGIRFHFDCQPENLAELEKTNANSSLKQTLSDQVDSLNASKRSALILGGNTSIEGFREESRKVFDHLINFFKKKQIKPSYFWGQDSTQDTMAQTRAYYTAQNDTWHILKVFKDPTTQKVSGPPHNIQELSRTFQNIHLSSRDTLYLDSTDKGDKPISSTRLNMAVFIYHLPQKFKTLKLQFLRLTSKKENVGASLASG